MHEIQAIELTINTTGNHDQSISIILKKKNKIMSSQEGRGRKQSAAATTEISQRCMQASYQER
jgi:hypothetical protein